MSLYRLCPWWSAQCPDLGEQYDAVSLHCFALVDEPHAVELLCVGSHSGYLSLFQPHPPYDATADADKSRLLSSGANDDGEFTVASSSSADSKPVDLVLEVKLAEPILSVSSAVIISTGDKQRQLIVLHPHSVAIYAVRSTSIGADISDISNQTTLELCIEHRLQHAAFSVCHGHFGHQQAADRETGNTSGEFLCVTHLNSSLTFFEQNGISYECRLPGGSGGNGGLSLPGQLCYVGRIDAFVRVSAAGELECYRYQDASECAERQRPLEPVWKCCVGEWALDMRVVRTGIDQSAIVLLGECNLVCITDNGTVRFIKRLDYTPICFESFLNGEPTDPHARLMTVVVTDRGGFVLIYAEAKLVWCLQLSSDSTAQPPVAIRRANLRTLRGAFVTLGASGLLGAGFLGTLPHPYQAPAMAANGTGEMLDVPRARQALAELEMEIDRTLQLTGDEAVQSQLIGRELSVQISVTAGGGGPATGELRTRSSCSNQQCLVSVLLKSNAEHRVDQVQVHFYVCPPLRCSKPLHSFRNLGGSQDSLDVRANTVVQMEALATGAMPSSLHATAIVSFVNSHSVFRVVERRVRLPIGMFARLAAPVKEDAAFKLTLSVDGGGGEVPTLSELLEPHFNGDTSVRIDSSTHAIGVEPTDSAVSRPADSQAAKAASAAAAAATVTIVSAKNSNRYRLQCATMTPLLPMLLDILITSLRETPGANSKSPPVGRVITVQAHLPVAGLCAAVECHRSRCVRIVELQRSLEVSVAQMRLIVRRLFVKLDDNKVTTAGSSLDNLQMLFGLTQSQLEQSVRCVERAQVEAQQSRNALSAWLVLLQLAVRYSATGRQQRRDGLMAILWAVPIRDWLDKDWPECVQPSVDLMRHGGALTVKDPEAFVFGRNDGQAAGSFDMAKLLRNLKDLFGPLCQGNEVTGGANDADVEVPAPPDENEWLDSVSSAVTWQL